MNSIVIERTELATDYGTASTERRSNDRRGDKVRAALVGFDVLVTSAFLALMRDGGAHPVAARMSWQANAGLLLTTVLTILLLGATRAYDPATRLPGARLRTAGQLALFGWVAAVVAALVSGGFDGILDAKRLVIASIGLPAAWVAARILAAVAERRVPARTVVLGTGSTARHVWELSLRHRECAFEVVGFLDDEPLELPAGAPATLGQLAELPRLVAEHNIELVIVAYTSAIDADVLEVLRTLQGVRVQVIPRLYEIVQARGYELGRITVLEAGGMPRCLGEHGIKRALDILGASLLLLLLCPLLLAIAIVIKVADGGPIIFRQRRVGKGAQVFSMLKFRTMVQGAELQGSDLIEGLSIEDAALQLKAGSAYMHATRIGRRLRLRSLDELPQLWNVIRGDMGLVGPRPMREYEVEALSEWQAGVRHSVRPGITGLWQVSGRNAISWEERLHLDCVYARHWSVTSDIRILARTVAVIVRGSDTA
ncbi:MAG TPA: exopolysaccharide biosynthesis polyprenyl glycosylphosphotransferase [Gaiellales bacterium]|nr:exopolysaccharide biosynthesis polyprenyl glycosylphosphotransferase [Gaiellales bacterium]